MSDVFKSVSCLYDLLDLGQSGTWLEDGTILLNRPLSSSKLDKIKFRSFSANLLSSISNLNTPTLNAQLCCDIIPYDSNKDFSEWEFSYQYKMHICNIRNSWEIENTKKPNINNEGGTFIIANRDCIVSDSITESMTNAAEILRHDLFNILNLPNLAQYTEEEYNEFINKYGVKFGDNISYTVPTNYSQVVFQHGFNALYDNRYNYYFTQWDNLNNKNSVNASYSGVDLDDPETIWQSTFIYDHYFNGLNTTPTVTNTYYSLYYINDTNPNNYIDFNGSDLVIKYTRGEGSVVDNGTVATISHNSDYGDYYLKPTYITMDLPSTLHIFIPILTNRTGSTVSNYYTVYNAYQNLFNFNATVFADATLYILHLFGSAMTAMSTDYYNVLEQNQYGSDWWNFFWLNEGDIPDNVMKNSIITNYGLTYNSVFEQVNLTFTVLEITDDFVVSRLINYTIILTINQGGYIQGNLTTSKCEILRSFNGTTLYPHWGLTSLTDQALFLDNFCNIMSDNFNSFMIQPLCKISPSEQDKTLVYNTNSWGAYPFICCDDMTFINSYNNKQGLYYFIRYSHYAVFVVEYPNSNRYFTLTEGETFCTVKLYRVDNYSLDNYSHDRIQAYETLMKNILDEKQTPNLTITITHDDICGAYCKVYGATMDLTQCLISNIVVPDTLSLSADDEWNTIELLDHDQFFYTFAVILLGGIYLLPYSMTNYILGVQVPCNLEFTTDVDNITPQQPSAKKPYNTETFVDIDNSLIVILDSNIWKIFNINFTDDIYYFLSIPCIGNSDNKKYAVILYSRYYFNPLVLDFTLEDKREISELIPNAVDNYGILQTLNTTCLDCTDIYNEDYLANLDAYLQLKNTDLTLKLICDNFPTINNIVFYLNETSMVDFKESLTSPQEPNVKCRIIDASGAILTPDLAQNLYSNITVCIDWQFYV